ncbi:MAG TPA: branched-chain-amino-acid transaminase [Spirochaetota bacterium]|nr:branched-chain-amino-acid transaminase [Spirochaetota bacterium]
MKIYIDGKLCDKEKAVVSVFDHGLLYGDGVFEGIRIYNGKVFKHKEHIDRLYASAKTIMLDIGMSKEEMMRAVTDTVSANNKKDGYIRLVVTRGVGDLGVSPATCKKASVIIIVGDIQLYPKEFYDKGIPIMTSSVRRISPDQFDTRVKSLNYLNNVLAKIEAQRAGCQEAVMHNKDGYVAECTGDNIFVVKNGVLITPAPSDSTLEGVTRGTVLSIATRLNIPSREARLTTYDLYNADECFLTGTGAEIVPVSTVDGRVIGDASHRPLIDAIRKEFAKEVM